MAHVAPIYPNFARGEVSPLMFGRIDIEQYPSCLDKCRNVFIRPYGCATRISGTEFIANTKNNGKARLLKFVFSATDSYIIECGAGYFRFYQDGAPVTKSSADDWATNKNYVKGDFVSYNGNIYYCLESHTSGTFATDLASGKWVEQDIYEVPNEYYEDQLASIQYVQLDDIIKLTCLPHNNDNATAKPKELIRNASNDWTFRNVTFTETPYLDQNTTDITLTPSATTGSNITITASEDYFTSSMVGANFWIGTKVTDQETNKDVQGYVKITTFTDAKHVKADVKATLSGTTATKLWGEGAFSDYRGYPSVVALLDGRIYYARTPYQPRNVYGSKPYAYETFTPSVNNEDDAGINITLATNANGDGSDIKWMIGASYLLCGTYGGEFVIRASGEEALTATDISARQRTNWGGEPVQPIVAGTFIHFLQRNGNKLRQFQYDYYYDAYKAVDVSIFSEHLLESPIKEMALQKNPDSIIYLMREDGKVVMLTLEQDQSVQAWSMLEELGAKVESIQTIPSYYGNYDEVYMVINRQVLSTTLTYECSSPDLTVTDNYTGTKGTAGTEIITLTYNSANGVWTNTDSTKLNTKLSVISLNPDLSPTVNYGGTKSAVGTITETLKFSSSTNVYWSEAVEEISSSNLKAIAYGDSKYIAITVNGESYISSDGENWSYKNIGDVYLSDITYGDSKFVIVANSHVLISSSGDSWTRVYGAGGNAITYGDNKFIIISYGGGIFISTDTVNWNSVNNIGNHKWQAITYGNGIFLALGSDGYVSTSTDGINWRSATLKLDYLNTWTALSFDGERFLAISQEGYISTSANGINWSSKSDTLRYSTELAEGWYGVTFNGTNYVALSENGYISKGTSGVWKSLATGRNVDLNSNDYKIALNNTPVLNDTLNCTWNTISGYEKLSDYDLTATGTPENNDTITLTYYTDYSGSARYIERMLNPITPENPLNWWYVRSGLKYDGYELTKGNNLTLSANSGTVTATSSSAIFTSSMVGNRIRFIDENYNILGEGVIKTYTSSTVVTLEVTTYFQSLTVSGGSWGISTDTLAGLGHLNGKKVQVFADGIEQNEKDVADGSIEIDDAFIAVAGLAYQSYITTMPMEAGSQNGTAVGKRKRISEMAIRVYNSLGVKVGRDLDNLYDTIYEQKEAYTGVIPNIKYNQGWKWDANITVEQSHPYPMNILSIAPIVTEVDK